MSNKNIAIITRWNGKKETAMILNESDIHYDVCFYKYGRYNGTSKTIIHKKDIGVNVRADVRNVEIVGNKKHDDKIKHEHKSVFVSNNKFDSSWL